VGYSDRRVGVGLVVFSLGVKSGAWERTALLEETMGIAFRNIENSVASVKFLSFQFLMSLKLGVFQLKELGKKGDITMMFSASYHTTGSHEDDAAGRWAGTTSCACVGRAARQVNAM